MSIDPRGADLIWNLHTGALTEPVLPASAPRGLT